MTERRTPKHGRYSTADIGAILGIKAGTVRNKLSKAGVQVADFPAVVRWIHTQMSSMANRRQAQVEQVAINAVSCFQDLIEDNSDLIPNSDLRARDAEDFAEELRVLGVSIDLAQHVEDHDAPTTLERLERQVLNHYDLIASMLEKGLTRSAPAVQVLMNELDRLEGLYAAAAYEREMQGSFAVILEALQIINDLK